MGMFDTIIFPTPIGCNKCGNLHESTQTKQFNNFLLKLTVGDILSTNIVSGIMEESISCEHKEEEERFYTQKIYLVIWNKILVDVVGSAPEAKIKLESFGLNALHEMYEKLYKQKIDASEKYKRLKSFAKNYSEYLLWPPEKQEKYKNKDEHTFLTIPDLMVIDRLTKEHPLISMIEELDKSEFKEKGLF